MDSLHQVETNFKQLGNFYHGHGFNVFPQDGEKQPPVVDSFIKDGVEIPVRLKWAHWQTQRQQPKDVNQQPWHLARAVAGVCGAGDLVCIDFDKSTPDPVVKLCHMLDLPAYEWTVATPGGGFHVWLKVPNLDIGGKSKLDRPGHGATHIELRHTKSCTTLPGSSHPSGGVYEFMHGEPTAPPATVTPAQLLAAYDAVTEAPAPVATTPAQTYTNGTRPAQLVINERATRYAETAMNDELDTLARTTANRNDALNSAAFSLGQLVGNDLLNESDVVDRLFGVATSIGLGEAETRSTIRSGITSGISTAGERFLPDFTQTTTNGSGAGAGTWNTTNGKPYEDETPPAWLEDGPPVDLETGEIGQQPTPKKKWGYRAEDGGILDLWVKQHSHEWIWVTGYDWWYQWNGTHWEKDETKQMHLQTQKLIDRLNWEAQQAKRDAKTALDKESELVANSYIAATKRTAARMRSVMEIAQPHRAVAASTLDAGNVLNLANGTLDLDTLEIRAHTPGDHLTYCLPYAYDATADAPRFKRFVAEVLVREETTTTDTELAQLFQELWGYTLTVDTAQHVMMWLSGEGGNGKSVALNVLQSLLGPMACNVNFQTLGTPGDYTLADLPGKRMVLSTESERGGTAAEKQIREIASGERQRARAIYGTPFEFKPVAKIWWAMNDRPVIKDTSNATWRRLKLIPFHRTFTRPEQDPHLEQALLSELPGILNWALEGLKRLRTVGSFTDAAAVTVAVDEYRKESNPVAQWLEDRTVALPSGGTLASELYTDYNLWCHKNGRFALNQTNFGTELKRLKIEKKRTGGGYIYTIGLIL